MMIETKMLGDVLEISLNRPKRRNALGSQMMQELNVVLDDAEKNKAVKCLILKGSGAGFCAGSDLKELAALDGAGMLRHEEDTAELARRIRYFPKVVIAQVEGFAIGGGFFLAISCDYVYCTTATKWHLPEVALGWIPPWGLQQLVDRVGPVKAKQLMFGTELLRTDEALRDGLVDGVFEEGEIAKEVTALSKIVASLPQGALTSVKETIDALGQQQCKELDDSACATFFEQISTEEAQQTFLKYGSNK